MSNNDDFLHGAGLGNVLPSMERRAMTKDRSLVESEEPKRAPIQYVEKVPADDDRHRDAGVPMELREDEIVFDSGSTINLFHNEGLFQGRTKPSTLAGIVSLRRKSNDC